MTKGCETQTMEIETKVLDILFRQISPERVLNNLKKQAAGDITSFARDISNFNNDKEQLFMDFAETTLYGYSADEQKLLYQQVERNKADWTKQTGLRNSVLTALIKFGQETLVIAGGEPRCKADKTLLWRDTYLRLGQDNIVCPFLAWLDYRNSEKRSNFTWPVILKIDDDELYHMLSQGMAENHNHINGSTQSFQLTWCRLMNYPENIRTELKHFQSSNLYYRINRGKQDNSLELFERLELAALLRSILFRTIHSNEFFSIHHKTHERLPFNAVQAFYDEYINTFSFGNILCDTVDCLRTAKGAQLIYPNGDSFCLDYVLDNTLIQHSINSHIRALVGERFFLYQCTQESLNPNGFNSFEQGLFYLYLILKCNFRSEMIQANGQTGFRNFLNYQDRKADAWEANPYVWEASRMAINYPLDSQAISSFESRLVPKADANQNIKKVYNFDRAQRFAKCSTMQALNPANYEFDTELDLEQFAHLPYFFVYHFTKRPDDRNLKKSFFNEVPYRHKKHRQNIKAISIGLASALRKSAYLRNRVRGIDASASEIGCRPEVFACAFRYLDGLQQKWNTRLDTLLPSSPMRISKTYHAGEDFLDIADGLRAIDETVNFLKFDANSRIGHALALGVLPEEHYTLKNYEITTTKQDRLDDLVWILYRSKEFGVQIARSLESQLQNEAYQLFREIYGNAIDRENWNCRLIDYYRSMKLRSDDPSVYKLHKKIEPQFNTPDDFDYYLLDNSDSMLSEYRNEDCIHGLYFYYHYGSREGIYGQQPITCKIDRLYVQLMQQIQDAMQQYLETKRIVIECNPSSNVLIGTFKKYEHHPVFRFNNRKLETGHSPANTQLQVCLNTDDLGIFDTSLEFEYALIGQALLSQTDENMKQIYGTREVIEYLDDLRKMGISAVFPENIS